MARIEAWLKTQGEAMWRASRTARQVAWGVFIATLAAALMAYQQSHVFPWQMLWYDGVVLAVATFVAFYQNRPRRAEDYTIEGTD